MSWFLFAAISLLGWGFADLFYKKGTDDADPQSHLKIAVWVGLVMGVCALILIPFSETFSSGASMASILSAAWRYAPASISYIVSMVIGYAGLRYLELSIVSPVQNASGALSALCMILFFLFRGDKDILSSFSSLDITGTALIVAGVIALAIVERRLDAVLLETDENDRKYKKGALALLFPILYCVFDTIGTAADGILLDGEAGLSFGEIDILVLYGLTFLLAGLIAWIWIRVSTGKFYNPFAKKETPKAIAACCEEFGQIFYVYAMSLNPVLAAPMIGSYCIVSVLLSRFVVKEKLTRLQYLCVSVVILGIVLLGISEGLAE